MYAADNSALDVLIQRLNALKTKLEKGDVREMREELIKEFNELRALSTKIENINASQELIKEINLLVFQRKKTVEPQQPEIEENASTIFSLLSLVDSGSLSYSSDDNISTGSDYNSEDFSDFSGFSDATDESEDENPFDARIKPYGSI